MVIHIIQSSNHVAAVEFLKAWEMSEGNGFSSKAI